MDTAALVADYAAWQGFQGTSADEPRIAVSLIFTHAPISATSVTRERH
jgi:hypothetical protein